MDIYLRYIGYTVNQFLDSSIRTDEIKECLMYSVEGGKKIRSLIYMVVLDQILKNREVGDVHRLLMNDGFLYPELIHTASLILDDMPHMDNDQIRRDAPTVHVKYGKGKAQLSSFILVQLAHQHLSNTFIKLYESDYINSTQYTNLHIFLNTRYDCLGEKGLAGGQYLDLYKMSKATIDDYMKMIEYKTSRLFEVSFTLPYCLVFSGIGLHSDNFEKYRKLGCTFGFIFQLLDDLVDYDNDLGAGKNVLDYMNLADAISKVNELYSQCLELSNELSMDLSSIWKLLETNFPYFKVNNVSL